ncbi:hypothetical protein D3C71_1335590 [compost metagenome]
MVPLPDECAYTMCFYARFFSEDTQKLARGTFMSTRPKAMLRDEQRTVRVVLAKFCERTCQLRRATVTAQRATP